MVKKKNGGILILIYVSCIRRKFPPTRISFDVLISNKMDSKKEQIKHTGVARGVKGETNSLLLIFTPRGHISLIEVAMHVLCRERFYSSVNIRAFPEALIKSCRQQAACFDEILLSIYTVSETVRYQGKTSALWYVTPSSLFPHYHVSEELSDSVLRVEKLRRIATRL
jgi:hypothetical protein